MPQRSYADVASTVPQVLRDYAFLADGERGILVGPRGDFAWLCFPGWADEAVLSSLIGGQGSYAITPTGRFVWGGYYEDGSLIWRSHWVTDEGNVIECREALALPGRPDQAVVLRRVIARHGTARVSVRLELRAGFGTTPLRGLSRDDNGCWHGQTGEIELSWSGGPSARVEDHGHRGKLLHLDLKLEEGEHHDFVLTLGRERARPPDADASWSATVAGWDARVPALEGVVARRDARHAYAVLSGLTSSGGGMVAAATTSLPERARQGRSYDYRYVWIRDQSFVGQAVAKTGPHQLLDDAVRFVSQRLLDDGPDLTPAYTTSGGRVPDEHQLGLPGYPGGNDTIGNWVNSQFQLDAFGEALLLFAAAATHDHLETDGWHAAEVAAAAIQARWREPDAGIWEIEPDEWTHSRLICAAGLRAISAHHPGREHAARWLTLADQITAHTSAHALHRSGRWQRSPGDPRVDVALLLPSIRGAIPADDPRTLATLHAIEQDLTQDGYVYRFRHDASPLAEAEGAFLLCGFIMSLAYGQCGDQVGAARWFERTRAACGPPGLLTEEFDVEQRQLRGNLPQAFVHALLLECAAADNESSMEP